MYILSIHLILSMYVYSIYSLNLVYILVLSMYVYSIYSLNLVYILVLFIYVYSMYSRNLVYILFLSLYVYSIYLLNLVCILVLSAYVYSIYLLNLVFLWISFFTFSCLLVYTDMAMGTDQWAPEESLRGVEAPAPPPQSVYAPVLVLLVFHSVWQYKYISKSVKKDIILILI